MDSNRNRGKGGGLRVERRTYDLGAKYARLVEQTGRFGVRKPTLASFIAAFIEGRELAGRSPETLRSYHFDLGVFAAWVTRHDHPEDPAAWDIHLLRAYVAYLQRKPSANGTGCIAPITVRSYTSRLLAFLRWLYAEGYLATDLAQRLAKPAATHRVIVPLTPAEVHALAQAAKDDPRNGERDLALLCLMLDCGARASEVCRLLAADVLWDQRLVKLLGKGDKERVVPVSAQTIAAMRRYGLSEQRHLDRAATFFQTEEGWTLTTNGLHHIVKKLGARSGVPGVHPHMLRHTFAITFLRHGGNALALQRMLGHTTLAMTNRYVLMVTSDLEAVHAVASPVAGLLDA